MSWMSLLQGFGQRNIRQKDEHLLHKIRFLAMTQNEIDSKHCVKQFGREPFTTRYQVASLENANKY